MRLAAVPFLLLWLLGLHSANALLPGSENPQWMVLFRDTLSPVDAELLKNPEMSLQARQDTAHVISFVQTDADEYEEPIHSIWGFNASSEEELLQFVNTVLPESITRRAYVSRVKPALKQQVEISAASNQWGRDRIDQRNLPLNNQYNVVRDGTGVTIFVVDTGVDASHSEFTGRVSTGYAYYSPSGDCDGHGTHVASSAAGTLYGVATKATIVAVKVLDCSGSGTTFSVAQGLNWVLSHLSLPAVINLSLGYTGIDLPIDSLLRDLMDAGAFIACAAGNSGGSACNHYPSATVGVMSVASSTKTDARSSFSNKGSCVHLFAPGSEIIAAQLGGGSTTLSGTSMASPHVAGAGALILQANPLFSSAQTKTAILNAATADKISDAGTGSPNRLLFVGSTSGTTTTTSATTATATTSAVTIGGGSGSATTTTIGSGGTSSSSAAASKSVTLLLLLFSLACWMV